MFRRAVRTENCTSEIACAERKQACLVSLRKQGNANDAQIASKDFSDERSQLELGWGVAVERREPWSVIR